MKLMTKRALSVHDAMVSAPPTSTQSIFYYYPRAQNPKGLHQFTCKTSYSPVVLISLSVKTEKRHPPQSPENEWKGFKTPLAHRPVSCPAVFGLGTVHRHLVTTWDYFPSLEASPHWNWNVIIGVIQLKYQHQSIWTSSVLFAVFQCLELRQCHRRANGDRLLLLGTD